MPLTNRPLQNMRTVIKGMNINTPTRCSSCKEPPHRASSPHAIIEISTIFLQSTENAAPTDSRQPLTSPLIQPSTCHGAASADPTTGNHSATTNLLVRPIDRPAASGHASPLPGCDITLPWSTASVDTNHPKHVAPAATHPNETTPYMAAYMGVPVWHAPTWLLSMIPC